MPIGYHCCSSCNIFLLKKTISSSSIIVSSSRSADSSCRGTITSPSEGVGVGGAKFTTWRRAPTWMDRSQRGRRGDPAQIDPDPEHIQHARCSVWRFRRRPLRLPAGDVAPAWDHGQATSARSGILFLGRDAATPPGQLHHLTLASGVLTYVYLGRVNAIV